MGMPLRVACSMGVAPEGRAVVVSKDGITAHAPDEQMLQGFERIGCRVLAPSLSCVLRARRRVPGG